MPYWHSKENRFAKFQLHFTNPRKSATTVPPLDHVESHPVRFLPACPNLSPFTVSDASQDRLKYHQLVLAERTEGRRTPTLKQAMDGGEIGWWEIGLEVCDASVHHRRGFSGGGEWISTFRTNVLYSISSRPKYIAVSQSTNSSRVNCQLSSIGHFA